MGILRELAKALEKMTGVLVIHPAELHQAIEAMHLRRFFDHFGVDCVWDVGANRGQYATHLRRDVGFRGPIISFEPMPEIADELRRQSAGDPLWFVETLALDREAGPAIFNVMASDTFSSLRPPAEDQPEIFLGQNKIAQQISVMRSTVAVEFPKWRQKLIFNRPFLKMDTQGNDLAVVQGAGETLQEFIGLQSELAIRKLYDGAPDFVEALAEYVSRGFELSAFVPNTAGHFPVLVETDCILFRKESAPSTYR